MKTIGRLICSYCENSLTGKHLSKSEITDERIFEENLDWQYAIF